MRLTSVKLVDGSREMILLPRMTEGVRLTGLSAPYPDLREVVEDRTDDDGTRDTTALFGARAVSIELLVTKNPRIIEDELSRFMHPRVRPYLVVEDDGWSQARRLRLRAAGMDAALDVDLPQRMRRIQAQWRAPDGVWEAAEATEETVTADVDAGGVGISLPVELPFAFEETTETGASVVTNPGAAPSHFVARLYGPCTAPSLVNETTGEQITFTSGLVLSAGEYVEIDTRERTATHLSNTGLSRLAFVDFAATSWWRLEPGENKIRYAPRPVSPGAAAVITYRPTWL